MPIDKVCIKNYKSLNNIEMKFENNISDLHCLLGKNGAGKSNFLSAIKYFFDLLGDYSKVKNVIDTQNPYIQKMEISIVFDFRDLLVKSSNSIILEYRKCLRKYLNNEKKVLVKLTQYKDNSIKWYPCDKEFLKIIKKVFPIYFIDTRSLNLSDWNVLWDIIGDLSKTNLKIDENHFSEKLDKILEDSYGEKYSKSLKVIQKNLERENISVNEYDFSNRFKLMIMARIGGSEFTQNGNKLSYYSDGLNSFNYLKILFLLIPELAEMGWKNPLIMIDELEIGLHPQFVKLLINNMKCFEKKGMNFIISTHSPIVVSEVLKSGVKASVFRVFDENSYTLIERMNAVIDDRYKSIMTMNEASCYFSNALLFVEGISEMQLFTNDNIRKMFPFIEKVDIYPYDSNNSRLKFMNPDGVKFNIPYLLIIDMDKILVYKKLGNTSGYFAAQTDKLVNPISSASIKEKEKYLFYANKDEIRQKLMTYNLRQLIEKILKNTKFTIENDTYNIDDKVFNRLLKLLKVYCLQYNTYPVSTTIEGVIVNENNIDKVIDWLFSLDIGSQELMNLLLRDEDWGKRKSLMYRTTIIRLILHGKLDHLQKYSEWIKDKSIKKDIDKLRNKIGDKAEGWISNFIDYYFTKYICCLEDYQSRVETFKNDFPELEFILKQIEIMVK